MVGKMVGDLKSIEVTDDVVEEVSETDEETLKEQKQPSSNEK